MGQFTTENETPFAVEVLALSDEEMRPLLVVVVKATYDLKEGAPRLAKKQMPVDIAGEFRGDPQTSSYKFEPECAFIKPATDVVLIGHAYAPASKQTEVLVDFRVGTLRKTARVLGERTWFKSMGQVLMTKPLPFEKIPLAYERAFGGWDKTDNDPAKHRYEPRNPVGVGFRASARHFEEGLRLPNLEDPEQPLRAFGQVVPPVGFGFISPYWQPRATLGGTYDEGWDKKRKPLLPKDFDRRFFNAASAGLVATGYLRGDEPVLVDNASPRGRLVFRLPGQPTPKVIITQAAEKDAMPEMRLDTVVLDTDEGQLLMLWRGHLALPGTLHDVLTITIRADEGPAKGA
ncbi:DUF2169 domain-containing protein [Cystobacter fuscus]|uniref:DUF2169 family type VI secretion system accessory protein n=1 Tax=Cystobacter fuscus TaxID=43 RepID=UPI002B2DC928|nr:DUF2169 domain-containing protein [Cystobacter fuscus]